MGFGNFMSHVGKTIGNGMKKAGGKAWEGMKQGGRWLNDHKYEIAGAAIQGIGMYHGIDPHATAAAMKFMSKASKGTAAHDAIKRMKRGSGYNLLYSKESGPQGPGSQIKDKSDPKQTGLEAPAGIGAPTEGGAGQYLNIHLQGGRRPQIRR
jgi:hypothetical protein